MKYKNTLCFWYVLLCSITIHSQEQSNYTIKVIDKNIKEPLRGAHVQIGSARGVTNIDGVFIVRKKIKEPTNISVSYLGYETYSNAFSPSKSSIVIELVPSLYVLNEVEVLGASKSKKVLKSAISKELVSQEFIKQNRENSLMQSLQKIAGVSAITIGSGQSKPTIRGLGFNRVVVVENGVKHEAQQWGADHGLEIDQFNIESLEISKGASSLLYGSDAIAGAITIKTNKAPEIHTFSGGVNTFFRTNNNLIGTSIALKKRVDEWYYKIRLTYQDYGDFKVPVKQINYDNYVFELHENNLRNTAGYNLAANLSIGYVTDAFTTETTFSNINDKNGFFANAHGLEVIVSTIDYDARNRDIDLPYHSVNHFKVVNNSKFLFSENTLKLELGYQNNHREEHSEPVAHGYMPKPNSTKERQFTKNTYTLNISNETFAIENHTLITGVNLEYQQNNIGGWGFLIPSFTRFTAGAFVYDKFKLSNKFYLEGGLRYDYGNVKTKVYYDWFDTPVDDGNGNETQQKLQRASNESLNFGSYSASLGASYIENKFSYKINLGKSFRIPLANELSSDGVNYHMYRYEEGNSKLKPESSYQLDTELRFSSKEFGFRINPFLNHFNNYIYLNPTPTYYETLQKYKYTQSEVFRYGGELFIDYLPTNNLELNYSVEYVKSKQLSGAKKNFTLPFSPPLSMLFSAMYTFNSNGFFKQPQLFADYRITSKQDEIVPPERPTPAYNVLNLGLNTNVLAFSKKNPLGIQFKVNNIFSTKYFNHASFYRLIQVPEPSRNFSISILQTF